MTTHRKLAAILSADAAGYSRLMADDEGETLRALNEARVQFRKRVEAHGGRLIDTAGDSILAEFPSAVEAVDCADEIQHELVKRNRQLAEHRRMQFRIGINLGDVIEQEDGTIYGDGVTVAARLEALAEPGGVCISGTAFDQVEGKLPLQFKFIGEQQVKNIAKPVRAYRVLMGALAVKSRLGRTPRKRTLALGAAVVIAMMVAVGTYLKTQKPVGEQAASSSDLALAMPTGPAIAVLPFTNMSSDSEQDFFADGITEQLITELSRFRNLYVIARNSTFKYKGQAVDVRQVGRELGARYVLEGSVRREARRIRVTAQLLDARNGVHLWAESYERDLTVPGIFEVQDDIAQRVVGAVGGAYGVLSRATLEQSKRKAMASLDAYECVLRTYEYFAVVAEPEHFKVRECLERSVRSDQNYSEAWAALSRVYVDELQQEFNLRPDPLGRGHDAAQRAIDLDPNNQRAHEALAFVAFFRRDLDAFFPLAERAVALNPNYENTLAEMGSLIVYSNWTNSVRRDRGLAMVKKAMALNPSYPTWLHLSVAWVHWWKGEHEQALAQAKQINMPDYFWTNKLLAVIYVSLGRKEEAAVAVAKVLKVRPDMPVAVRAEWRKWNVPEEVIDRAIADLRRAGMEIPPGT